ncbi:hypothetical protein JVU11DRAFT_9065 [Chiua virens]|nr:hypothetical protein JVU11DRAFT_9065 [Chiua virens]
MRIQSDAVPLQLSMKRQIKSVVTLITHNTWRLDFNLAIASFEDNIRASQNLLKLGLDSPQSQNLRFLFTSSIGSAHAWDNSKGRFSEEIQFDSSFAIGSGYGEAKYAAERIITKSGLHSTSLRIGQIARGVGGSWATTDWFPILVKSSIALGALPESAGVVSWLREEDVAAAILETAFSKKAPPPALNLVNPCGAPWAEIIAFVRRAIIKSKSLEDDVLPVIPFGDWFALFEKRAENASEDDLANIPAIKLLEFFRRLAQGGRRSERQTQTHGSNIGFRKVVCEVVVVMKGSHPAEFMYFCNISVLGKTMHHILNQLLDDALSSHR